MKRAPAGWLDSFIFHLIIWGFVGARLYHVLNEPVYYWDNPLDIVKVWNGGLAIHGAIIAGVVVVFFFSKTIVRYHDSDGISPNRASSVERREHNDRDLRFKQGYREHVLAITDLLVVGLTLGQVIGRWGNYFNQELFGKPTDGFFKVFIDVAHRPAGFETIAYYHPTFFYESVLNLILFSILYWGHGGNRVGQTTSWYLIGYGLIRFFVDFLRIDPRPFFGGLYLSQWVSMLMIVVGVRVWYTIVNLKAATLERPYSFDR